MAFSAADIAGRAYVVSLMRDAGLAVRIDTAGNIIGRREGTDPDLPVIMTGSHTDSVPQGGNYDGDVGVLGASQLTGTTVGGVRFDFGRIAPKVRLLLGVSYFRSDFDQDALSRFEARLDSFVNPGTPDSVAVGQVRLGDIIGDIDLQYIFPQGRGISPRRGRAPGSRDGHARPGTRRPQSARSPRRGPSQHRGRRGWDGAARDDQRPDQPPARSGLGRASSSRMRGRLPRGR